MADVSDMVWPPGEVGRITGWDYMGVITGANRCAEDLESMGRLGRVRCLRWCSRQMCNERDGKSVEEWMLCRDWRRLRLALRRQSGAV